MKSELKEHILKGLAKNIRYDGRKKLDYRDIKLEIDATPNAEGSARVVFGDTELIVGVKMSIETPYPDTPDNGNFMVNTELLPLSNPNFERGPPSIEAIELSRVTDRGIRESKAIDTKKLCIEPGEKVWGVIVDICTINAAGGLFDAAGLATIAALKSARFPGYKNGQIDYKEHKDLLPMQKEPIPVTVFKIGEHLLIDPLEEEEKVTDARLSVTTIKDGSICSLQKGGETPLSVDEIDEMIGIAQEKSKFLRTKLNP